MSIISTIMTLSTGHITRATAEAIESDAIHSSFKRDEGFIFYTKFDRDESYPAELRACLDFAKHNGCDWLMFDCDGDFAEPLPRFEW